MRWLLVTRNNVKTRLASAIQNRSSSSQIGATESTNEDILTLRHDALKYQVFDPSFDNRPTSELLKEFAWMRERVLQIRLALLRDGRRLVPLSEYFELCKTVDRGSH